LLQVRKLKTSQVSNEKQFNLLN